MDELKTISKSFLDELIDFNPNKRESLNSVAELQRDATVAAFNMLVNNECAYLADEVGMGKTYVALGVMCLLRYFDPTTRVIVITPRANIQAKWKKDLENFVSSNWKVIGNRVKSLDGSPVWQPVMCQNLAEFAHESLLNHDRDFFLRMTSFSVWSKDLEAQTKQRDYLRDSIPALKKSDFVLDEEYRERFLYSYGVALNAAVPQADLVIVDEAHNLRHGFERGVSIRNQLMTIGFGSAEVNGFERGWYERKATRLLLLSATPFENDYGSVKRQLQIFGFEKQALHGNGGQSKLCVEILDDPNKSREEKQKVLEGLLIRRAATLTVGGQKMTKNMYRREWRRGGLMKYDKPIRIDDVKTQLVLALVQKKVSEVLNNEKFNNNFQVGMLSSFESFAESLSHQIKQTDSAFDGVDQQRDISDIEKKGVDTDTINDLTQSYRNQFSRSIPHPKQDKLIERLSDIFVTGEKSLIFVRRVATVGEVKRRLCELFDEWIKNRFKIVLIGQENKVDDLFELYQNEKRHSAKNLDGPDKKMTSEDWQIAKESSPSDELIEDFDDGGLGSFFEWFLRGAGPENILSGKRLKDRFQSAGAYSTVFEDNYVAWILDCAPKMVLTKLCEQVGKGVESTVNQLRANASKYYYHKWKDRDPEVAHVYASFQVAGLMILVNSKCEKFAEQAKIILREKFEFAVVDGLEESTCLNAMKPKRYLSINTVFSQLRKYPELREQIWPQDDKGDSTRNFIRQEQRRELFARLSLLGLAYIDLYLLAAKQIGSISLDKQERRKRTGEKLAIEYVKLLEKQSKSNEFNAYYELSEVARTFEYLKPLNFPNLDRQSLSSLPRYLARILGYQEPVGGVSGKSSNRLVSQFRMPGFPVVLVSTDVLQEGEDLHTYCKQVIHYGIAWNPSSVEQRTGRVDRIGSLAQRKFGGSSAELNDSEKIQVYYPYLSDTVERIQVEKVLEKVNTFVKLIHQNVSYRRQDESKVDLNRDIHASRDIAPIEGLLKSAFEIEDYWLNGDLSGEDVASSCVESMARKSFECLCKSLQDKYHLLVDEDFWRPSNDRWYEVQLRQMRPRHRIYPFEEQGQLRVKSHVAGEQMILQFELNFGNIDLQDAAKFSKVDEISRRIDGLKLCLNPRVSRNFDQIFVRDEILFDLQLTGTDDALLLIDSVFRNRDTLAKNLAREGVLIG